MIWLFSFGPFCFDDWPTLTHLLLLALESLFFDSSSHHDWPTSLGENPLSSVGAVWEKLFRMIPITVPGFPGNDCRPLVLSRPNLWRPTFVAGVRRQISTFRSPLLFLRHMFAFCGIGIPFAEAPGTSWRCRLLFSPGKHGWWRAEKGTKESSGVCWSRIYRSEEEASTGLLYRIAPYHPGSLRFHHLCSSSVTQLACMMSSDWKSYGVMSGSHCWENWAKYRWKKHQVGDLELTLLYDVSRREVRRDVWKPQWRRAFELSRRCSCRVCSPLHPRCFWSRLWCPLPSSHHHHGQEEEEKCCWLGGGGGCRERAWAWSGLRVPLCRFPLARWVLLAVAQHILGGHLLLHSHLCTTLTNVQFWDKLKRVGCANLAETQPNWNLCQQPLCVKCHSDDSIKKEFHRPLFELSPPFGNTG